MRPQDLTLKFISSDPQPDTYADRIANGSAVQELLKAKLVENHRALQKWLATTFGWGEGAPKFVCANVLLPLVTAPQGGQAGSLNSCLLAVMQDSPFFGSARCHSRGCYTGHND